ncbi:MAG: hypothetical protein Q7U74_07400, partial [Saprospiraceae bacterium]|nr:hypothetical protein [Saprospiraceae bacterium]
TTTVTAAATESTAAAITTTVTAAATESTAAAITTAATLTESTAIAATVAAATKTTTVTVAATVAVSVPIVIVSPLKIPVFHLSECFVKKMFTKKYYPPSRLSAITVTLKQQR